MIYWILGGLILFFVVVGMLKKDPSTAAATPSTPTTSRIPAWLSWGKQQQLIAVVSFWLVVIGVIIYFISGVVADAKSGNYEHTGTPEKFYKHPEVVSEKVTEQVTIIWEPEGANENGTKVKYTLSTDTHPICAAFEMDVEKTDGTTTTETGKWNCLYSTNVEKPFDMKIYPGMRLKAYIPKDKKTTKVAKATYVTVSYEQLSP